MATYTTISDALITTGQPVLASTGRALRDNPVAIAEGASGAPRIQTPALQDGLMTLDKFPAPVAGDTYRIADVLGNMVVDYITKHSTGYFSKSLPSNYKHLLGTHSSAYGYDSDDFGGFYSVSGDGFAKAFVVRQAGSIRFRGQHNDSGNGTSYMYVTKNDVDVARWSTTSATYQARTVDITVAVGDVIQVGSFNAFAYERTQCRQVYFSSSTPAYMAMQSL